MNAVEVIEAIKPMIAEIEKKWDDPAGVESEDFRYFYEDIVNLVCELYHPEIVSEEPSSKE